MTNLEPEKRGTKRKATAQDVANLALNKATPDKRPRRKSAGQRVSTEPALRAVLEGRGIEGPCGGFKRTRKWYLANGRQGLIIQKVTRAFDVERFDSGAWTAIGGATLNGYVTDAESSICAGDTLYWECWKVNRDGVAIKNEDSFALCSLIPAKSPASYANTTKGSFTITGEASFYPTEYDPEDVGFAEGAVAAAGELFSRATDPAGELTRLRITAAGDSVTYTVTSTWDSTWPGPPNTTEVPFIPPQAYSEIT